VFRVVCPERLRQKRNGGSPSQAFLVDIWIYVRNRVFLKIGYFPVDYYLNGGGFGVALAVFHLLDVLYL